MFKYINGFTIWLSPAKRRKVKLKTKIRTAEMVEKINLLILAFITFKSPNQKAIKLFFLVIFSFCEQTLSYLVCIHSLLEIIFPLLIVIMRSNL